MIPTDHPRYRSLVTREHLADCARKGIVSWEGLISNGRGEAFDYLLGKRPARAPVGPGDCRRTAPHRPPPGHIGERQHCRACSA